MLKSIYEALTSRFPVDADSVAAYMTVIPSTIHVTIESKPEHYIARVNSVNEENIEGLLITEASSYDELLENVNDLVFSYIDMPVRIRRYYSRVLKPQGAQQNKNGELTLVKA